MAKKLTSTDAGMERVLASELDRSHANETFYLARNEITSSDPVSINLDTRAGGTYVSLTGKLKPILDLDGVKAHIDSGETLNLGGKNVITYTFNNLDHLVGVYNNKNFGFGTPYGFSPFDSAQKAEAREAIQLWDDLIPQSFKESKGLGADIQFANSFDPAQAYAYYPGSPNYLFHSDVFVATPVINWTNAWLGLNGYGATTLVHELGHSLGLSHPGAYNFGSGFSVNYANGAEYAQDSLQYTIMSYWRSNETGARTNDYSTFLAGNAQTPLLHDILTIQAKYGADPTTRATDTIYGFGATAGNEVYDFSKNAFPYLSIYDAGGNDTINLSDFNAGVFLNLHAGSFSSAVQAIPSLDVVNANRAALTQLAAVEDPNLSGFQHQVFAPIDPVTYAATVAGAPAANANRIFLETRVSDIGANAYDNISIAYGTTIENGIGGSARDLLWGNEVANRLEGRGGNDVLDGYEGKDILVGGDGNDTFTFHNVEKGDRIVDFTAGDKIDLHSLDRATFDFSFIGTNAFSGHAGEVRYAGGVVEVDLDGVNGADLTIILDNQAPLTATDFIFG